MLYTRQAVQENVRNRDGKRVFYLGKGHQLTSDARDWLARERITILPADQAKPERYALEGGGFMEEKPEHMTHLYGNVLVPKTHPRIAFRGAMDTLQAELLLCIRQADKPWKELLEQALQAAKMVLSWEVMEEPAGEVELGGMSPQQLRDRSHRPQDYYGQPHFMPSGQDSQQLLLVNRARTLARQAELAAARAFCTEQGVQRQDLMQVLNRLSSFLYLIMIQMKREMRETNGSAGTDPTGH